LSIFYNVGDEADVVLPRQTMDHTICHLFERPQLRSAVAELIHNEFWTDVPGASAEKMAARLGDASTADALPLCLIALHGDEVLGAINLVDNDDDDHTDWHPWLAGMVVAASHRGRGIGSQLVRALLVEAQRLNFGRVYFGTDGPRFYEQLGAVVHHVPREGFWFMRFDLPRATTSRSG
jgi:predicted N-acetyltransferase YhbS